MSSTHTHGRLYGVDCSIRAEETGICVAVCLPSLRIGQEAEDLRRLVACWNAFDGIPTEQVEPDARVQSLIDVLAVTEQYLLERLSATNGTGSTKILPLIRRAIEGAGVAPTQSTWADC